MATTCFETCPRLQGDLLDSRRSSVHWFTRSGCSTHVCPIWGPIVCCVSTEMFSSSAGLPASVTINPPSAPPLEIWLPTWLCGLLASPTSTDRTRAAHQNMRCLYLLALAPMSSTRRASPNLSRTTEVWMREAVTCNSSAGHGIVIYMTLKHKRSNRLNYRRGSCARRLARMSRNGVLSALVDRPIKKRTHDPTIGPDVCCALGMFSVTR